MTELTTVELPDGRRIAAAEYGAPGGAPLFYFHGYPGSRLEARLAHEVAEARGLRLIALDRPGFGRSTPRPGRTLASWPDDVAAVADRLALDRFAVVGMSGGAPFAVACAARLGERVTTAALLCGMGPPGPRGDDDGMIWHNRLGLRLAASAPWLAAPLFAVAGPLLPRLATIAVRNLDRHTAECDRSALRNPALRETLLRSFREGLSRGGAGMADDGVIFGAPWGLDLGSIRARVLLWHGERDQVVPVGMARRVAAAIPGCVATFYDDEGHFSLGVRRADEIFDALCNP